MWEQSVSGPMLTLVGIILVLFRTKLGHRAASYYQRAPGSQERSLGWSALLMGLAALAVGYYAAYVGELYSLLIIGAGALLALFSPEYARATVAWQTSATAQTRGALVAGSVATLFGLLMTIHSALQAL